MLTGSLYVADSLNSGVAISGYKDTGFVRSLGYEGFTAGFPGFLLWSGSALSGSAGTKGGVPYSGVGLELYLNTASYFRYSTADDELYVATRNFFLGDPNTSYISGSNGILEISSSNFLLSSSGDVFANDATFTGNALANIIRDKTVIITTANSASYLQSYTAGDGSATTSYRVKLDGSLGGERVRRIRINCSLLYPIGDFSLPNIGSNERLDFVMETSVNDTRILDIFNTDSDLTPVTFDQITLQQNATITLTTGGNIGSSFLITAGTQHPLTHEFQRNVIIGDYDKDGGTLRLQSSASFSGGTGVYSPQIILNEAVEGIDFKIGPARVTSTTSTIIGQRTIGNWEYMYGVYLGGGGANEPHIALSSSLNQNDRRILLNGATQLATRIVTATGGSPDITLQTSDSVIVCNHGSGTCTIALGTPTDSDTGRIIRIINRQTGTVTINGSIYIPGTGVPDTSRVTSTQYASIELLAPGSTTVSGWIVLNESGTWS